MLRRLAPRSAPGAAWTLGLALACCALSAASARATSTPNLALTLDASVPWSLIGASGTVDAFEAGLGALDFDNDAICLDGACGDPNDFSNQDWIVFRVTVDSGSLDQVTLGALFESSIGLGYFDTLGGQAPTSGDSTTNPNSPEFFFSSLTGQSAPLFAAYTAGSLPSDGGPFGPGATNFALRLGGATDGVTGFANTVIPEPSTGLLLALGLLACTGVRRLRSRK